MALRNRPMTEDEARKMLADWRVGYPKLVSLWSMVKEPTPHTVNYRTGRMYYHAPHHFPILPKQRSPSDCTWIVPGTLERKL